MMIKSNSTYLKHYQKRSDTGTDDVISENQNFQNSDTDQKLIGNYLSLCRSISEGFCIIKLIIDDDGEPVDWIFIDVNPAFEKHTGLQNPAGKSSGYFLGDESRHWLHELRNLLEGSDSVQFIHRSKHFNKWFEVSACVFGQPEEHMAAIVFSDVTEKKSSKLQDKKEQKSWQILKSDARFSTIIEAANEGICLLDENLVIRYINKKISEMSGYSQDEVYGRSVYDFMGKMERTRLKRFLQQGKRDFEISLLKKNGILSRALVMTSQINDGSGKLEGYLGMISDISQRVEMEKDLKKTKKKLEIALDNGKIGTWEWNIRTNEVIWDRRMEEMFNLKPGTFEGKLSSFEKCVHEEDLPHVKNAISEAITKGKPYEIVYRTRPVSGKSHYISSKALLMRSNKGNPLALSGVAFDITDMKEGAERVLIKLNEELLRSNADLSQFAAVATHDLQEPLRMVASYTQLLKQKYKDSLDEDALDYINYAVDGSKRMYEMINGLLAYSRVNMKESEFRFVDMNLVVGKIRENMKFVLKEKNAVIRSQNMPVIYADENQIIQLLQNLIENSIKFSNTSPEVEISSQKSGNYYIISLKDNGIGIEPQYFEKIFRIFQRLHTRQDYSGAGIGLAICRKIVERHSGKIWVKSEVGKGSTFSFSIPVR